MNGGYICIMKIKTIMLVGTPIILLLAGCASQPVVLAPVGPEQNNQVKYASTGHLRVFSDTKTREIGENTFYYTHTRYVIQDENGKIVKIVPNHIGDTDEMPTLVTIPSGNYKVVAQSSSYGRVTVPVFIQAGQTTVVHLDRNWKSSKKLPTDELVYLPNGEAVGWRDSTIR